LTLTKLPHISPQATNSKPAKHLICLSRKHGTFRASFIGVTSRQTKKESPMNKLQKSILAASSIGIFAAVPVAYAIPFSITGGSLTPASGYGVDSGANGENGGTLLDVRFSTADFLAQSFGLNDIDEAFTFKLGSVTFLESDQGNPGIAGIHNNERDNLGLTASFVFGDPIGTTVLVYGSGIATSGRVDDPDVDYILSWTPEIITLGNGAQIEITLEALSFSGNGSKTQMATISLLRLPDVVSANAVPEPVTLSLLGLGIAGIAATRRKPTKSKAA
jgi:hypothetical protein